MSAFYYEEKITALLGVSRDVVRQIREDLLEKEEGHWEQQGRDIVLSQAGLDQLLAYLYGPKEISSFDLSSCLVGEKNGAEEMKVQKLLPNKKLLMAITAAGTLVKVKVRDSSNFRPGMKLRASPAQLAGFYQLEGRCPRYPGRY